MLIAAVGEGGTYALFQGLFPTRHDDLDDDRTLTGDSLRKPSESSAKLSQKFWWPLLIMVSPLLCAHVVTWLTLA